MTARPRTPSGGCWGDQSRAAARPARPGVDRDRCGRLGARRHAGRLAGGRGLRASSPRSRRPSCSPTARPRKGPGRTGWSAGPYPSPDPRATPRPARRSGSPTGSSAGSQAGPLGGPQGGAPAPARAGAAGGARAHAQRRAAGPARVADRLVPDGHRPPARGQGPADGLPGRARRRRLPRTARRAAAHAQAARPRPRPDGQGRARRADPPGDPAQAARRAAAPGPVALPSRADGEGRAPVQVEHPAGTARDWSSPGRRGRRGRGLG